MKNTNYCIIDHVGSIDSKEAMENCYALAEEIKEHGKDKTYKMKAFCKKIYHLQNDPSKGQKFKVRFDKHPEEVIFICNDFNTNAQWVADIWAEKVDSLKIIEAINYDNPSETYLTLEDIHPEWFTERYMFENSIYRRCANIWANALGWTFTAPLYRDNKINATENYVRNKQACQNVPETHQSKLSKIATRPESFLNSKAVASEDECKQFFTHYKWLQQNDMLADSLEPGYELCPHCHRPIFESAEDCDWCDFHREAPMNFTPYFDDSYNDEDWD